MQIGTIDGVEVHGQADLHAEAHAAFLEKVKRDLATQLQAILGGSPEGHLEQVRLLNDSQRLMMASLVARLYRAEVAPADACAQVPLSVEALLGQQPLPQGFISPNYGFAAQAQMPSSVEAMIQSASAADPQLQGALAKLGMKLIQSEQERNDDTREELGRFRGLARAFLTGLCDVVDPQEPAAPSGVLSIEDMLAQESQAQSPKPGEKF